MRRNARRRVSPIVLVCAFGFVNTFSIGVFPVLLPEMGRAGQLSDFELGVAAAAFGCARLFSDIPVGLFITNHLRRAIVMAPVVLITGVLCISAGGPLALLVLGRGLIGAGHALGTLTCLTTILRYRDERTLSFSLGAFDMSGIVGVLAGMALVGFLPTAWPWHVAFLVACIPQLFAVFLLPRLLAALPAGASGINRRIFARNEPGEHKTASIASMSPLVPLAFAAAAAIALSFAAVGQFILPMRADRQFGLDRSGVASLLALPQLVDVICVLPIGMIADRTRQTASALGVLLITFAAGLVLVAFSPLRLVILGCVLFGIGLAGWVLPLSLLRTGTPPQRFAWRTAQYRVAIDMGMFLGPFLSGMLGEGKLWILSASCAVFLAVLGLAMLFYRSESARAPSKNGKCA